MFTSSCSFASSSTPGSFQGVTVLLYLPAVFCTAPTPSSSMRLAKLGIVATTPIDPTAARGPAHTFCATLAMRYPPDAATSSTHAVRVTPAPESRASSAAHRPYPVTVPPGDVRRRTTSRGPTPTGRERTAEISSDRRTAPEARASPTKSRTYTDPGPSPASPVVSVSSSASPDPFAESDAHAWLTTRCTVPASTPASFRSWKSLRSFFSCLANAFRGELSFLSLRNQLRTYAPEK
mmetsp:Transcript_4610/g.9716  ORF Transcript_4610/g.9716 Transcript_4610/m.9716 type:complete len:236 (+) Transcript_4610:892-1599(+)